MSKQETRIKRGHITLMKHPSTALYSGVMLMGTSSVEENVPTAYTDGINKIYSIRRTNNYYFFIRVKTIHFTQELVDC